MTRELLVTLEALRDGTTTAVAVAADNPSILSDLFEVLDDAIETIQVSGARKTRAALLETILGGVKHLRNVDKTVVELLEEEPSCLYDLAYLVSMVLWVKGIVVANKRE